MKMTYDLLLGTYTRNTSSEGIYGYSIAGEIPDVRRITVNKLIENPSFLIRHPRLDVVYCVNEVDDFSDVSSGAVSAFSYRNGKLEFLNQHASLGADPCHLTISTTGDYLLVSNYSGGNFASLPLSDDGQLGECTSTIQHGTTAHVHSTTLSTSGKYIYVADLALDQIVRYPINPTGRVEAGSGNAINLTSGAGPRHFCLSGDAGYLFNELNSTIVSFKVGPEEQLTGLQTLTSLPNDFAGVSSGAHIDVSADGRFLYASNRGDDSVVVFEIDGQGEITPIQFQSTLGKHPRHFAFSPDQKFLLVANRDTSNVVFFRRSAETGLLSETGCQFEVPVPVFLLPITRPQTC